jgi:peptidoglycan/xylan/chitin deacetylase (PgdA/CDA1 family)
VRVVDEAVEGDEDPVSGHADETHDPDPAEHQGDAVPDVTESPLPGDGGSPETPAPGADVDARRHRWSPLRVVDAAVAIVLAAVDLAAAIWLAPVAGGALPAVMFAGALLALAGAALALRRRLRRLRRAALIVGSLTVAALMAWIGANSPTADWFGHQVAHGSRDRATVAITFDDGPNTTATEEIARILDQAGTKGTFFVVGKAANRRPDIVQFLVQHGQLVGNHSQNHDETRWLDPRYLELGRAERSINGAAGVCPAWYRAPHGQHTPFLAHVVASKGMTMVGWDVSAGDWLATDPKVLADQVVARARPGSIIDLHDGLDGDVTTDRTVLVRALPLILAGLERKGLQPVRLDQLLGGPAYLRTC